MGGFVPSSGFVPSAWDAQQEERPQGAFWKAMEVLNRPSSAVFGAATGMVEGDDPVARAWEALKGEQEYSGTDLLTSLGADPESLATKAGGFALTVLNPLDPLNYVGIGAATKAGRAARLLGRGANSLADATRAGERGLVTFAGHKVPLPGDAAIMGGIERAGQAVADSSLGRAAKILFGGKRGPLAAATDLPEEAKRVFEAQSEAERLGRQFEYEVAPHLKALESLPSAARGDLLERIGLAGRGEVSWDDARAQWVAPGTAGAPQREAAWDAAEQFMSARAQLVERLQGTGVGAFAQPQLGYFPRVAKAKPGVEGAGLGQKLFDEKLAALQGPSANSINRMLVPGSLEPVAENTLTEAGRAEFRRLGGAEVFRELEAKKPEFVADFLERNRLTPGELNQPERNLGFTYETNPAVVFQKMRDDAIANIKGDELVAILEKQGIAQQWDEGVHGARGEDGRFLFAKIDQGRYAKDPLAVPWDYARAMQRVFDTLTPTPEAATMAGIVNQALPQWLKDAGLMQWWKGLAIFGGGPAYFVRNFGTAVLKNRYEGLTLGNPQTLRLYPAAMDVVGKALGGKLGDEMIDLGGVQVSKKRLVQEYVTRNMGGGGSPDVDILEVGGGLSKRAREKVFRVPHKINAQVEMLARMPLAMKIVEDTFNQARKAGMQVPAAVGALGPAGSGGFVEDVVSRAFSNAEAQVKLSHFDYTDLSPFEQKLRNFWVPFYTWLRKNVPHETTMLFTQPGKFMPFVRAYYRGLEDSGLTPEDMPEWMQKNFALPVGMTKDGRREFLDLTGFLPFMDLAELANAAAGQPRTGSSRASELIRYGATRANPFVQELAEMGLRKDFLTGREWGDYPQERFGMTVSPETASLLGLVRPLAELDRVNPGNVWTKVGNASGAFVGDVRPHRNEPSGGARAARFGLGLKFYAADADQANMSRASREREGRRLLVLARRAVKEGRTGDAAYLRARAAEVMGQ